MMNVWRSQDFLVNVMSNKILEQSPQGGSFCSGVDGGIVICIPKDDVVDMMAVLCVEYQPSCLSPIVQA